jgi:hypothetical protein
MKKCSILFNTVVISVLAFGCGSNGGDGDGDGDGDVAEFQMTWGPLTVPAGSESTQCVIKSLGNDTEIRVNEFNNELGATSHHFIVYRIPADTPEQPEPFPCQPFTDILDGAPLMITQKASDTLNLPDGVAYTLEPDQKIRLEMHYINATDSDQELGATATFRTIPEGRFEHEADFIFVGDVDINIPPNTSATVGPTFLEIPPAMYGVNFFAITGHTHQWGTDVRVGTMPAAGGQESMVYDVEPFNWDEPETVTHAPAFTVPDGGGFNFSCEYNNQSNSTVGFGEGANDEMCFFWAYYYPSTGEARVCAQTDQITGGFGGCCPEVPLICNVLSQL